MLELAKDSGTNPEILYYLASKGTPEIRRAVAANKSTPLQAAPLLAEARENGAHKAILFAAGETASKIYESIGFERIGDYRVALFETPEKVPAQ